MKKAKKFYITTSIAYANGSPHIGFALEVIQADVLARYHRILGEDVFFLTGTDEHGAKIEKTAKSFGKTPGRFTNEISAKFKKLAKILNISNDDFIRTTDKKRHLPAVNKAWLKLKRKGDVYKKTYKGLYCVGCEAFVQEKDLVDGKCPIHKKEPEVVEEENYFFRLSKYIKILEKKIAEKEIEIIPKSRENEVLSMIKQGIGDISISRARKKLKWGIKVPDDPRQTIYVWVDALLNYISALGYPNGRQFKKYWPADIHCIGKDILKFHALVWPAMLLSLDLELPRRILVHGFINVDGQKMSKSLGNVIDPFSLVKRYEPVVSADLGAEALRYFFLREIPATEDGDFTYQKYKKRYNSDLASGIGNLVSRVRSLAQRVGRIKNFEKPDCQIQKKIQSIRKNYKRELEKFNFNAALGLVWELISFSDRYIEKKKPWREKDNKAKDKNKKTIANLLYLLKEISFLLTPFLPKAAESIERLAKIDKRSGELACKKKIVLFPRIKE
ncbi:MAG TPA: methionine--tRNA ligase [Candidatus Parcubacteria bacterium]|nr:methionine--tRNA ligase [Candidatus Parcubacteria bacterium]